MLIWGIRWIATFLGQFSLMCPQCGKAVIATAIVEKGKFTLFFVPIFPVGTIYSLRCNLCGLRRKPTGELLAQLKQLEQGSNVTYRASATPQRLSGIGHSSSL